MKRVIVTGGIGAGKSTVAKMFEERGWKRIDADEIGHRVLEQEPVIDEVRRRWPSVVVDGRVDRRRLGGIVFANPADLAELESIVHPEIRKTIESEADTQEPVVLELSVPSIKPRGEWLIVVVDAPEDARRMRLRERGLDEAQIDARILAQPGPDVWRAMADVVIDNGGSIRQTRRAVAAMIEDPAP